MHQIHYFLKVARMLNVTRAAEELHVSQPSLSRQIKLLEEELGVLLFERLPQGLRLTPAGGELQAHLEAIVQRLAHTPRLMEPYAQHLRGRVNVGCVPSLSADFLPGALADFLREHPGVETAVHVVSTSAELFRKIHDGTVDIGLCADEDPDLAQAALFTEPLLAAVPAASEHAAGQTFALDRLRGVPYVATPPTCQIRRTVEAATDGRLNLALEVEQIDAALQFVARGVGVTVAPLSVAIRPAGPTVRFLPLLPPLSQTVCAFWRPQSFVDSTHPLVKCLQEHGQSQGGT